MRNPFTQIANKFTQTYSKVRDTIFRQRQKDAGTKKETARGKGGGGSSIAAVKVTESTKKIEAIEFYRFSRAVLRRAAKRRSKNKVARKSRRINSLKRKHRKAA